MSPQLPPAAGPRLPLTVLVATRNEEVNLERCLATVAPWADQVVVIDSESTDRTREIATAFTPEVHCLPYDHSRIIPWIFQWALDSQPIRNDWILILEADQVLPVALREEIEALLRQPGVVHNGFYIRRRQIFRGKPIRFGGYGSKYLLKLFRRSHGQLDPAEQDTRVYVDGSVGYLKSPLEEWNKKEDAILFYLEKHLRYADAFAREEMVRHEDGLTWKLRPKLFGTSDERTLWLKRAYYRSPLFLRAGGYFLYRYFFLLGILDGKNGFVFHFLQAFWFRLIVDIRLDELRRQAAATKAAS